MQQPFWLTIYVDLAPEDHEEGLAFWRAVTGYDLSEPRGDHGEFLSLVPPRGDEHLKVQRLGEGPSRLHLDVHVHDIDAAVAHATSLGARLVSRTGYAVMTSPGGFPFCFVRQAVSSRQTPPAAWAGGHHSRVDQLCLDIAPEAYDTECRFWAELTGWPVEPTVDTEFRRLRTPAELTVRILLQRLQEPNGPDRPAVRGHIDIATDDMAAETARLEGLGSSVIGVFDWWTALDAPGGVPVCATRRDPRTGVVRA